MANSYHFNEAPYNGGSGEPTSGAILNSDYGYTAGGGTTGSCIYNHHHVLRLNSAEQYPSTDDATIMQKLYQVFPSAPTRPLTHTQPPFGWAPRKSALNAPVEDPKTSRTL